MHVHVYKGYQHMFNICCITITLQQDAKQTLRKVGNKFFTVKTFDMTGRAFGKLKNKKIHVFALSSVHVINASN